jgi:histone H3/H4
MTEQPEALRLAAVPIFDRSITWQSQATIELRRLAKVEAQRDALLEALRECATHTRRSTLDPTDIVPTAGAMIARAAIKAVEGEK